MSLDRLPEGKKIILFDGVCGLCNKFVRYVIARDKRDLFRFASLDSELGQQIARHIGIDTKKTDSILLYEPGVAYYYKSQAVIQIMRTLHGLFTPATLLRIFPGSLSDSVYDFVAKNRYKWFGRFDACPMPSKDIGHKFL